MSLRQPCLCPGHTVLTRMRDQAIRLQSMANLHCSAGGGWAELAQGDPENTVLPTQQLMPGRMGLQTLHPKAR